MAARYFLFYNLFISSCLVAGQSPNYALKGGKVSLKPVIAGHPDGILWKYNGNKVVEFNGREQDVYSPYENRITLDWVSAELDISDLRFEDSGDYELDVTISKRLHRSLYKLEVIDKVAEPTITCEMNDGDGSNTSGKLLCSVEPSQPPPSTLMKFEWRTHGNVQPGPQLQISLGDTHDDEVYSCRVSNRLSSETATFTAKDCYPDASSSALLIAILVTVAVLVLVGLAILYCKIRHKACFAKDDPEKRSPPGRTEESDKEKAQDDEKRALVHRVSTLPSTQRLGHLFQGNVNMRNDTEDTDSGHETVKEAEMNQQDDMPKTGHVRTAKKRLGLNGDADAEQHRKPLEETEPQSEPSDSERDREPEPAALLDNFSEDTQSKPTAPISPEHAEPEKEADEDEEAPPGPADAETCSAAQPHSPLTESSPSMAPEETAGEHEEVANSDQATGESAEKDVRESDSPDEVERNESDDSSKDKLLSVEPASNQKENTDSDHETVKEAEMNLQDDMPKTGHVRTAKKRLGLNGDADAEQHRKPSEETEPQSEPSDSERDREPEPAALLDNFSEDTQSKPTVPISPEHAEPEKEADEDEGAPPGPADAETCSAAQPHSPLTESSPSMAPEETAGEHEEVANSDQATGESAEKDVRESDSPDEVERNESDDSSKDKLLSAVPEQRGSKTLLHDLNLPQEKTNTSEDNQQETVKLVSEDDKSTTKDKSITESVGDHEETDREQDLYSATSQQPRSPTPTKPDNKSTDTCQESPDTAHTHLDEEEEEHKTSTDSEETEGQSDKGEGKTVEDKNEVPCGLKGEEQGNESCSGDNAGQKKDEVVA